jgi:hypothetical protein
MVLPFSSSGFESVDGGENRVKADQDYGCWELTLTTSPVM